MEKELDAQKKRVAALKYLESQGQSVATNFEIVSNIGNRSKTTDNTLELLLKEKTSKLQTQNSEKEAKNALIQQQRDFESTKKRIISNDELPPNWKAVYDDNSSKYYYWNQVTNETVWEKPIIDITTTASAAITSEKSSVASVSVGDWIQMTHSATQQLYWMNKTTGEKSFATAKPTTTTNQSTGLSSSNSSSSSSKGPSLKDIHKYDTQVKKRKYEIDPLDFTEGKGLPGHARDGKMADSTAGGPLWQQRPYPSPRSILKNNNITTAKSTGIGTSSLSKSNNIFMKKKI